VGVADTTGEGMAIFSGVGLCWRLALSARCGVGDGELEAAGGGALARTVGVASMVAATTGVGTVSAMECSARSAPAVLEATTTTVVGTAVDGDGRGEAMMTGEGAKLVEFST